MRRGSPAPPIQVAVRPAEHADAGEIVGWAASGRYRSRPGYDTSVETSAYVNPEHTGRRVGTELYEELFRTLRRRDAHRAAAGIALPNPASISLHERFGFREVGRFSEQGRK